MENTVHIGPEMFSVSMGPLDTNALLGRGDQIIDYVTYRRYMIYKGSPIVYRG